MKNTVLDADCIFEKKKWISVTGLCNNNCLFCLDKGRPDTFHKKYDELLKEITEAKKDGATKLIISGGDPTIYPRIIDLVKESKKLGFSKIQLITNGRMFSSKKFTEEIIEAGLGEVTFSLHGHTAQIHDVLTNVPGSFKQIIKGILNVSKTGIIINTDTCITKLNFEYLPEIIQFIHKKLNIHEMNLMSMVPQGNAWVNRHTIMYDYSLVAPYVKQVLNYAKQNNIYLWLSRFPGDYLEGYEEFIEDPYKLIDDVRGRYSQLKDSVRPVCQGAQCEFCCVKPICDKLIQGNSNKNIKIKKLEIISEESQFTVEEISQIQTFKLISPTKRLSDYAKVAPTPEKLGEIISNIDSKLTKTKNIQGIPPCMLLNADARFLQAEKLDIDYSSLLNGSKDSFLNFAEILSREALIKKPECKICIFDKECEGIYRNYAKIYGLKVLQPVKQKELRINLDCNQNCDFCNTDKNAENVVTDNLDQEIIKSKSEGINYLVISGREPTLVKELPKLIEKAKEVGIKKIELQTNAITSANDMYAKRLAEAGLTHAFVSVHAHTEELSSKMTNSIGFFKKTLEGISNLRKERITVTINLVITSINFPYIEEIIEFISEKIDLNQLVISFFAPVGKGKDNLQLVPNINKFRQQINLSLKKLKDKNINFIIPSRCGIPLCFVKEFKDHHEDYLSSHVKDISGKIKLNDCQRCEFKTQCPGVWKEYVDNFETFEVFSEKKTSSMDLNTGVLCNNNCRFCMTKYPGMKEYFIEYSELAKEIIQGAEEGISKITFLGGEPTVHPKIQELVRLASKNSFSKIHIVSNGRRYSDNDYLKKLISGGVNRFSISIHSHLEKTEDYLTDRKGAFQEKIKGIENLIELSKLWPIESICINIVLNNKNFEQIMDTVLFFKSKGVKEFRINSMMSYSGNSKINSKELLVKYSKLAPFVEELSNLENITISLGDFPLCIFKNWKKMVQLIGECSTDIPTKNIFYSDTKEGKMYKDVFNWQDRKSNKLKKQIEECNKCKAQGFCEGVWNSYLEQNGTNEFKAILGDKNE